MNNHPTPRNPCHELYDWILFEIAFVFHYHPFRHCAVPSRRGGDRCQSRAGRGTVDRVSGDTTLAALNDGHTPKASNDRSNRAYGNWRGQGDLAPAKRGRRVAECTDDTL